MSKNDDLPAEYVPKSLRPPEPQERDRVMYACGWETVWAGDKPTASYGMFAGPFPRVESALEVVPEKARSLTEIAQGRTPVIVRFNLDGTDEVIYRWYVSRTGTPCWRRA